MTEAGSLFQYFTVLTEKADALLRRWLVNWSTFQGCPLRPRRVGGRKSKVGSTSKRPVNILNATIRSARRACSYCKCNTVTYGWKFRNYKRLVRLTRPHVLCVVQSQKLASTARSPGAQVQAGGGYRGPHQIKRTVQFCLDISAQDQRVSTTELASGGGGITTKMEKYGCIIRILLSNTLFL